MSKTRIHNILTICLLISAIIQAPIFYYYTFGLFSFFIVIPYLIIACGLTIGMLVIILKNKNSNITIFQKVGVFSAIILGSLTLFLGEDIIEKLDWQLRKGSRNEIIDLIKSDQLSPNVSHNNIICALDNWNFPPISNGGNEIAIYKHQDNTLTVEFYINRGFLDHYSAFVYTDNYETMQEFEERITLKKGLHINKKLGNNWYRISY